MLCYFKLCPLSPPLVLFFFNLCIQLFLPDDYYCFYSCESTVGKLETVSVPCDTGHCLQKYGAASQRLRVTQDLDLTSGDSPGSVCLPSMSLPPVIFYLVVLLGGISLHQGKLTLTFSRSIENSASTKWHLNKFCAVRICESSLWVGLPSAKVAVAWSGHMALIWDPSVSVSLSKARKTPRVPPVSHPVSVTAALRISPLFTVSPDLKYALSEGLVCAYFLPPLTVRCFKMISTLNTKFITFVLKTM